MYVCSSAGEETTNSISTKYVTNKLNWVRIEAQGGLLKSYENGPPLWQKNKTKNKLVLISIKNGSNDFDEI